MSLTSCRVLRVSGVIARVLWGAVVLGSISSALADVADRRWLQFSTSLSSGPKIQLLSDLGRERSTALLDELGRFDALVDQYVAPFVPLAETIAPASALGRTSASRSEPLQLVVMRRRGDFNRLFRSGHFAAFTVPTLEKTTLVVGPMGTGVDSLRENLLHEYVHYRLRRDVPGGLPLWFEEGLASFLSHVEFSDVAAAQAHASDQPGIQFRLGKWAAPKQQGFMSLEKLLAVRDLGGFGRNRLVDFYATSHAFVRYLYVEQKLGGDRFASSLVLAKPRFPDGVDVDLQHAQNALRQLGGQGLRARQSRDTKRQTDRRRKRLTGVLRPAPNAGLLSVPAPEISEVNADDVRDVLADATLLMNPAVSERLFARIIKTQPGLKSALLGSITAQRLQAKEDEAWVLMKRAAELWPDDPEVLLAESALATSGCIIQRRADCRRHWEEAVFSLRDVLDEQPDNYEAIYRLGLAHLYLGQPGEAQGYLEIVWRQAPWSPRVNYFMGESMRLSGDRRARWYLDNAWRWAASDFFRAASKSALDQLN